MRMRYLMAAVISAALLPLCAGAQPAQRCTAVQERQAENGIGELNNWARLFEAYRRYRPCDDGAIAEGYSDKIAIMLTKYWRRLPDLGKITRAHPGFERFVLKHIDTLMSPDQSTAIIRNAQDHCPAGSKILCKTIEHKARNPGA